MAIRVIHAVATWGGEAVGPHTGTATECVEAGDVLVLPNLPFEIALGRTPPSDRVGV